MAWSWLSRIQNTKLSMTQRSKVSQPVCSKLSKQRIFAIDDESRTVDQSEAEEEVEGFVFSTLKYVIHLVITFH